MKKIKLLAAFMALVLSASMLLTACGKKEEEPVTYKLADIMNADYVAEKDGVISSSTKLNTVGDYLLANGAFLATAEKVKATATDPAYLIKHVYNIETGKEVATLNEKEGDIKYSVNIISENYFAVLSLREIKDTEADKNISGIVTPAATYTSSAFKIEEGQQLAIRFGEKYSNSLTIRDANGQTVKTYDNTALWNACAATGSSSFDMAYNGNGSNSAKSAMTYEYRDADFYSNGRELFFIGKKLYRADKDGNMTLVKDFGLTKQPSNLLSMNKVGDFYLGSEASRVYNVYDKDINELYEYVVPGYAYSNEIALLASGELLVQYSVGLDQDAKEYDYIVPGELAQKYDLVTLLVNAEGETELTDVNYIIGSVKASVADEDGQKEYSDIVENLAFIYPIDENKYYNDGIDNKKLVLLSNKGEVTAEVEIEEKIINFPAQYVNGYYILSLIDNESCAIYDKSGAKVSELSLIGDSYATRATVFADGYICDNTLYDINGKQTKDLKNVNYEFLGNSLFITSKNVKGASYSLFADGKTINIGSTSSDKEDKAAFDAIASTEYGYYTKKSVLDEAKGKTTTTYTYYNEKGNKLISTEFALSYVSYTEDYVLVGGSEKVETKNELGVTVTENKTVFYRFDVK